MKGFLFFLSFLFVSIYLNAQVIEQPYNFPIKPGSAKWQSFKSVDEMYAACQIPLDTLKRLSTKALLGTCLTYPAAGVLMIHNTPQQGFDEWKQKFNGIQELFKRDDAFQEMLANYRTFDVNAYNGLPSDYQKGEYAFKIKMIELIIVQNDVLDKLNNTQKIQILKTSLSSFENMEANESFGYSNFESTGRLIGKTLIKLDKSVSKEITDSQEILLFTNTGLLNDRNVLQKIISEAKKIKTNE